MNPDWLEDCAEGRVLFLSLLLPVGVNRAIISVAFVFRKGSRDPRNEKLGKVGIIIQKGGDLLEQSYIGLIPAYFSRRGCPKLSLFLFHFESTIESSYFILNQQSKEGPKTIHPSTSLEK